MFYEITEYINCLDDQSQLSDDTSKFCQYFAQPSC